MVAHAQLVDAGVHPETIKRAARSGALHRRHWTVYALGHTALAPYAREQAALLACGEPAVLTHRSAAYLWGLVPEPHQVDVTVVGHQCRQKPGICLHRTASIDPRDLRRRHGLPATSPARTLIDFAVMATATELDDAIGEARAKRLIRDGELETAVARAGRRAGAGRVRAFLRDEEEPALTRSRAERRFRRFLRLACLPQPRVNVRIGRHEADFLWEDEKVVLEVDGWRFHGHRKAFESDRKKDMALSDLGYHVIRVTLRHFIEEPLALIAHIARVLDRRSRIHA
jgi:very-short-patch-repair endonuclease